MREWCVDGKGRQSKMQDTRGETRVGDLALEGSSVWRPVLSRCIAEYRQDQGNVVVVRGENGSTYSGGEPSGAVTRDCLGF